MAALYFTVDHISQKDLTRIFTKISISFQVQWNGIPCWEWQGSLPRGYGQVSWNKYPQRIHRLIYAWLVEPLPTGTRQENGRLPELDHLCRNKRCCNPIHLELVSRKINHERGTSIHRSSVTQCIHGHPFNKKNTRWFGPNNLQRQCITCCRKRAIDRFYRLKGIGQSI